MANRIADPAVYTTKTLAGGGEYLHINDGSADKTMTVDTVAARARLVLIRTASGTSDTLILADAGGCVHYSNASSIVATVPPNSSVAFPVGTTVLIRQYAAGVVTVTAGAGVTIQNGYLTNKTAGQYKSLALHKVATDTWVLDGNAATS
jgi:hypothetical protein